MYLIDRCNDESVVLGLFVRIGGYGECILVNISVRLRDKGVIFVKEWNVMFGTILLSI
jgi:hypothetical protein